MKPNNELKGIYIDGIHKVEKEELIRIDISIGKGTKDDLCRPASLYYTQNGEMIAFRDWTKDSSEDRSFL